MLLSLKEAAERLSVSIQTVHNLKNSGALHVIRVGVSKGFRVEEDEIARFLETRREHPGKNAPPPSKKAVPFKHLDGSRLLAAWKRQGNRDDRRDGDSAPSSPSSRGPSGSQAS